jgi:hypothetical protein
LNQYDENYDNTILSACVNDGTINRTDYNSLANYLVELSSHFRAKIIQNALSGAYTLTAMSFDISQMLISCRFQDSPCSANDFFQYYDFYYGICSRFNQGRDLFGNNTNISTVSMAGISHGLQLELYAGYAAGQEKYTATRGFRVSVFNKTALDQIVKEQGIYVATGFSTDIAVRRTVLTHLPGQYGPCLPLDVKQIDWNQNAHLKFMYHNYIDGSYYVGLPNPITGQNTSNWKWTLIYSQFFCLKLCFQKYIWEHCGCFDITIPLTPKNQSFYVSNACSNSTQMSCISIKQRKFYSNASLFGQCYTDCPYECYQIEYDLRVTTSTFPTEWYAALLAQDSGFISVVNKAFNLYGKTDISYAGNYSELRNAVARVNVYYESLSFMQIDETPAMTYEVFLGSVGGNMGLFLGIVFLF